MAKRNPGLGDKKGHYEALTQILSVTSWNGLTGDVAADVVSEAEAAVISKFETEEIVGVLLPFGGSSIVTSWNGLTGAVSFTQYVSAVGGATGAVASVDGGSFT